MRRAHGQSSGSKRSAGCDRSRDHRGAPEARGAQLIAELAGRLARVLGERETVADLAALAETWTTELAALEARVDEGLSTLEPHVVRDEHGTAPDRRGLGREPRRADATHRADRARQGAVRDELTQDGGIVGAERASLQERWRTRRADSHRADPGVANRQGEPFGSRRRSRPAAHRRRGAPDAARLSREDGPRLAGSRGVVQRLDE